MADITAGLVKELREKTGAGMMDCKKALTETAGNVEDAVDWLRKKGLAAAAKKSGRVAAEGLIGVASAPQKAAMVEVNAETDFVGRNDTFQEFVETVAKVALDVGDDVEKLKAAAYPGGGTVEEKLTNLVATIGENMTLRRAAVVSVGDGVATSYVHNALKPGLGKIGVLVGLEGRADAALETLGRQIGMHVAATRPDALDVSSVDPASLEREKNVLAEQARADADADAAQGGPHGQELLADEERARRVLHRRSGARWPDHVGRGAKLPGAQFHARYAHCGRGVLLPLELRGTGYRGHHARRSRSLSGSDTV